MVKVKICGITNKADALAAVKAGCNALGFVFFKKSPRYITPLKAAGIIKGLPEKVLKSGVFVSAPEKTVKKIAKACGLDILQFHGDETPEYCAKFKGYKTIKAFRVKGKLDLRGILKYKTAGFLFDTFKAAKFGGTGAKFDWKLLKGARLGSKALFLSGGLNEKNIALAIKTVKPDWVDVSSGVEIKPGKKDPRKIKRFMKNVTG